MSVKRVSQMKGDFVYIKDVEAKNSCLERGGSCPGIKDICMDGELNRDLWAMFP